MPGVGGFLGAASEPAVFSSPALAPPGAGVACEAAFGADADGAPAISVREGPVEGAGPMLDAVLGVSAGAASRSSKTGASSVEIAVAADGAGVAESVVVGAPAVVGDFAAGDS